jgi:hypothetical protein
MRFEQRDDSTIVQGRIVDAISGEPVSNANVVLIADGGTANLMPSGVITGAASATSSADGRFTIASVADGMYRVLSTHPQYLMGQYGQREAGSAGAFLAIDHGTRLTVQIKMWKRGTITGAVQDSTGAPVAHAEVHAIARTARMGARASWTDSRIAKTDDRGVFRLSDLVPGEYRIAVRGDPARSFVATYYPSAESPAMASSVRLAAGEEREGTVVTMTRSAGLSSVSGTVVVPGLGAGRLAVRLTKLDEAGDRSAFDSLIATADQNGRFLFSNVAVGRYAADFCELPVSITTSPVPYVSVRTEPGQSGYRIQANASGRRYVPGSADHTWWAEADVTADTQSAQKVDLIPLSGVSISGTIVFEGAPPSQDDVAAAAVVIRPVDPIGCLDVPVAAVNGEGEFHSVELPNGRFVIGLLSGSLMEWKIVSIQIEGREVAGEPISLDGHNVAGVRLRLARKLPTLSGNVRTANGLAATDATVLAFPRDVGLRRNSIEVPPSPSRVQRYPVDSAGRYRLDLLPGDYLVVAVIGGGPDFDGLDALAPFGKRATVDMTSNLIIDLTAQDPRHR